MKLEGGDDLEDDFVPDDLVALSEDEGEGAPIQDNGEFVAGEGSEDEEVQDSTELVTQAGKKRKRREREKEKKAKKRRLAESAAPVDLPLAVKAPEELAQYMSSMQRKTFPTLSELEIGDVAIPAPSITDTTSWTGPRTLDHLVKFIVEALPTLRTRLSQKSKANGSPTLLFIAGAALRVADITRILKDKPLRGEKGGEVAKLFSKHIKLADHVTYLKQTKVGAAVGTPGRIGKLLCETDALTISALSHIILDTSFRDAKNRTLFDIPETRDEVFKTVLGGPDVLKAIQAGKVQVVFF